MLLPLFAAKEVASDRGNEMHAVQCIAVQREEQPASYLERFFRGCCSYLPSPIDTAGKAILLRVVVRL